MATHTRASLVLLLAVAFVVTASHVTGVLSGAAGGRRHMLQESPPPAMETATAMPTPAAPPSSPSPPPSSPSPAPSSPSLIIAEAAGRPPAAKCDPKTKGLSTTTSNLQGANAMVVFNNVIVENRCTGVKVLIRGPNKSVPPSSSLVGVSGSSPGLDLIPNEGGSMCSGMWQAGGVLPFPPLFACIIQDCNIAQHCFAQMNCVCSG